MARLTKKEYHMLWSALTSRYLRLRRVGMDDEAEDTDILRSKIEKMGKLM